VVYHTALLVYKKPKPFQGFYCICNQLLSLRSPSHVRVRNNIPLPVSVAPTLKYHIGNIAQKLRLFFPFIMLPERSKPRFDRKKLRSQINLSGKRIAFCICCEKTSCDDYISPRDPVLKHYGRCISLNKTCDIREINRMLSARD
jgi:hypothetical protein